MPTQTPWSKIFETHTGRAISVQLARGLSGQPRTTTEKGRRRSHSTSAPIAVIPKLTVQGCSFGLQFTAV